MLAPRAAGFALPERADAAVAEPRIYDRAAWQGRPPSAPVTVLNHGPDHIVVHHTATANSTDYSLTHGPQLSRDIQDVYALDPYASIVGHCDYNATDRPGELLYGMLPERRDRVAAAMGQRAASRTRRPLPHRDGPNPRSHHAYDHGPAFP